MQPGLQTRNPFPMLPGNGKPLIRCWSATVKQRYINQAPGRLVPRYGTAFYINWRDTPVIETLFKFVIMFGAFAAVFAVLAYIADNIVDPILNDRNSDDEL